MFGLSAGHLLILGIVVLLFGSRRLPELGSSLGQGLRAFKDAIDGKTDESTKQIADRSGDKDPSHKA